MSANFTVGVPDDIADRLRKLATDRNMSRNAIVRDGIELVLAKYGH